jgi:hypothetical protein
MKHSQLLKNLLRVAGVGVAAATVAGLSTEALAGISATKHNLSASGAPGKNYLSGVSTTEICVFCHTPHGSDTSAPVPLWNKKLPLGTNFTTYATIGSSTLDAATVTTGSVSLACLSCHDGTQAMDNMMNAPGSGNYDSTGTSTYRSWNTGASWVGNNVDTATGKMAAGVITNIGQDLKNDHPIGIVYCGGYTGTTCVDGDFKAPSGSGPWWVETSGSTTASKDKSDMILYTRDFGGTQGTKGSVECASCHDPHVESKGTGGQVAFLRVSQENSGVCLACHTK